MAMGTDDISKLMMKLESWGELEVRRLVTEFQLGGPGSSEGNIIEGWLRTKEAEREITVASAASRASVSASEAVLAAREANDIARSAAATAKDALSTAKDALRTARHERTAAVIAAIAAIIAVVVAIIK